MNYPQLWRSSGLALSLLLATLSAPRLEAAAYTVRPGDTLTSIARRNNVSVASLQKANPKIKSGAITAGQALSLPASAKAVTTSKAKSSKSVTNSAAVPVKKSIAKTAPTTRTKSKPLDPDQIAAAPPAKTVKGNSRSIATYRVKSGDTLVSLARRNKISVADLVEMNDLDSTVIHENQKLILPSNGQPSAPVRRDTIDHENTVDLTPPSVKSRQGESPSRRSAPPVNPPATQGTYYHVVKNGDTFSSIARERGVTVAALTKANRTVNPNKLAPNQKINVPGTQLASRQSVAETLDTPPPARSTSYQYDTAETSHDSDSAEEQDAEPAPTRIAYRVSEQDTMDSISKEFGTNPKALRSLNQMGPFDRLTAGNFITVPWKNTAAQD